MVEQQRIINITLTALEGSGKIVPEAKLLERSGSVDKVEDPKRQGVQPKQRRSKEAVLVQHGDEHPDEIVPRQFAGLSRHIAKKNLSLPLPLARADSHAPLSHHHDQNAIHTLG
jgi:hypothetical protein